MATAHTSRGTISSLDSGLIVGLGKNRRATQRFMVLLPVVAVVAGDRTEHLGLVRDVGNRSLFIYSDLSCTEGSRVNMMLRFRQSAMQCRGEVVRVERRGIGAPAGMAIRLDDAQKAESGCA